ncbi:Alkyl hydroperoxide reductase/ Thiol specific antioxidant/ Mal allergen [unidentified eubacterium SCB49]|nr:Alkyl hydroperoxide reductase/ Thiol specific antioxidant/ Mal allergen [unidentified eubacterium SCB49]
MSIAIGSTLPEFTLVDQDGVTFNSKKDIGNTPSVIYFYPKNFTPGCTAEACSFRDAYEDFIAHNVKVIGISSDSESSHKKFASKFNLPFTLLADEEKVVRSLFEVKGKLLGLLPGRETFVFDTKGKLVFKFDGMSAGPHITKALDIIKEIKNA